MNDEEFLKEHPSITRSNIHYGYDIGSSVLLPEEVHKTQIDKQRVLKAIYKVTKNEPNKLVIVTDFLKELNSE